MTLKAVVENLDGIDESLHGEYIEKNGKFYLDLDSSIKSHTAVVPLANSLSTLKTEKATLKTQLEEATAKLDALPEDFDADQFREAMDAFEALKKDPNYKGGPKNDTELQNMRTQYEQRLKNLETAHNAKVAELEGEVTKRDARLKNDLVGRELQSSLVEAGVDKKYLKATHALLKGSVRVNDQDPDDLRAVVETDMGEVPLAEYVQNWSKSDEGKPFVVPATGGGAQPNGGARFKDNPFSFDNWNVTEQGRLYTEKGAEHAERLAKQAGTTVGGPRPASRVAA